MLWMFGSFIPNNPFRRGLTMDRSLHGLPPIRRSKGPHSASCNTQLQSVSSKWRRSWKWVQSSFQRLVTDKTQHEESVSALTHVFPRDGANVVDIFYLAAMFHHPHGDRVLTDFWSDVQLDLEAQISEHQVSCYDDTVIKSRLFTQFVTHLTFIFDSGDRLTVAGWTHLLQYRQRARAPWLVCADR